MDVDTKSRCGAMTGLLVVIHSFRSGMLSKDVVCSMGAFFRAIWDLVWGFLKGSAATFTLFFVLLLGSTILLRSCMEEAHAQSSVPVHEATIGEQDRTVLYSPNTYTAPEWISDPYGTPVVVVAPDTRLMEFTIKLLEARVTRLERRLVALLLAGAPLGPIDTEPYPPVTPTVVQGDDDANK